MAKLNTKVEKDLVKHTVAVGDSGVPEYGLIKSSELDLKLRGIEGTRTYDKMELGDSQLGMILRMIKSPIQSADWSIEPFSDDTKYIEHQTFIDDYIFSGLGIVPSFPKLLNQVLSFLQYGFSLFEVIWKPWVWQNKIYIVPKPELRTQVSIEEIRPTKQEVLQILSNGSQVTIPFNVLMFFIIDQEGDDMRGRSILRASFKDWQNREEAELIDTIGCRKMALGVPVMEIPKYLKKDSPDYLDVKTNLQNIGKSANPYMMHPPEYKFSIIEGKYNGDVVNKKIQRHNLQMAKSALVQFLELGTPGSGGAYALGDIQVTIFLDSLLYIVALIEEEFNNLIKITIQNNFGIQEGYPKLVGSNLNRSKVKSIVSSVKDLLTVGAIQLTQRDEDFLRDKVELPALTEDEKKERTQQKENKSQIIEPEPEENQENEEEITEELESEISTEAFNFRKSTLITRCCGIIDAKNLDAIKFQDDISPETRRRGKEFAKKRNEIIKDSIPRLREFMVGNLFLIKDKMLADTEKILEFGEIATRGLKNLKIPFESKYNLILSKKLAYLVRQGVNLAREDATPHLGKKLAEIGDIDPKKLSPELQAYVVNKTTSVVESQTVEMRVRTVLTVQKNMDRGLTAKQAIAAANMSLTEYIEGNSIRVAANNLVNDSLNTGQLNFTDKISNRIQGVLFSNPAQVKICRELKGKIFRYNSAEMSRYTQPLHFGCNSFWVMIYDDEPSVLISKFSPSSAALRTMTL